jgi:hypothetical protein
MDAMRESWTDARMDDLNRKVDDLGRRMDNGFNRVDADLRALREEANQRFERVDGRIDDLHLTIIHRTMLQLGAGVIVTLVVGFAGIIATQL